MGDFEFGGFFSPIHPLGLANRTINIIVRFVGGFATNLCCASLETFSGLEAYLPPNHWFPWNLAPLNWGPLSILHILLIICIGRRSSSYNSHSGLACALTMCTFCHEIGHDDFRDHFNFWNLLMTLSILSILTLQTVSSNATML